jgi:cardiolipin synthase A/B
MKWWKIASLLVLGVALAIFALIGIQQVFRGTPARAVYAFGDPTGPPGVGSPEFVRNMALLTHTALDPGHQAEILLNGDGTYPRLWQDLRSARETIALHVYYWKPGQVADSIQKILMERSRAGVQVWVLFDAFGAQDMSDDYIAALTAAGIRVAQFRPLRWYTLHKAQNRSHMRLIVIDDRIGYTGGFGAADHWLGDGRTGDGWRETNVRFTGPAILQTKAAFAIIWAEATGSLMTDNGTWTQAPLPAAAAESQVAGLLYAAPALGSTVAERFLALSIAGARQRLFISNPYFLPNARFVRLLVAAARRGVDVRVLTAGPPTDIKSVRHAGHALYDDLLRGGVRVYEYAPTMMHSKTMVVDGRWSTVGTMNFDNRSIAFNDESNLVVDDTAFGRELELLFFDDLRRSREFKLELFRQRSLWHKLIDKAASQLATVL